jgi:hypothetical protein
MISGDPKNAVQTDIDDFDKRAVIQVVPRPCLST